MLRVRWMRPRCGLPDTSQNNRLEKREALDLALFHKLTSGDPESFVSQFFVLLAHVMKHSSNGSQLPQLGELAAHLADLKKSEALRTSQAPEIRNYLEQLNATQGDILKRLRTLPASPAVGDTWGKRLAWQVGIGLGSYCSDFWPAPYAAHGRRTPAWML